MSILDVRTKITFVHYHLYYRDAYIDMLRQTEDGQNYLKDCYRRICVDGDDEDIEALERALKH